MKKTALFELHKKYSAKMVEFAGYEMPIEYDGIKSEHIAVREAVGVFDVSHMGEIWVKGRNALHFIQYITTNDASALKPGQAQYSCLPNGRGGIVDDLLVYCFGPEKYLLVINASNIQKDWDWLTLQNNFDVVLENTSGSTGQLAVQGPKAKKTLQKLTEIDLLNIKYYTFTVGTFAGINDVIISATGYTGSGGFELYFDNMHAEKIWRAVFDAGKEHGIKPIGLGARNTLRLEMGYCLYGSDIDDTTSPLEAGLGWITKFTDEKEFIDKKFLLKQKADGINRRLRGFEMIERGVPRQGYKIMGPDNRIIGHVTSGSQSPILEKGIGMGYINKGYHNIGAEIFIQVRRKNIKAKIAKLPFIALT